MELEKLNTQEAKEALDGLGYHIKDLELEDGEIVAITISSGLVIKAVKYERKLQLFRVKQYDEQDVFLLCINLDGIKPIKKLYEDEQDASAALRKIQSEGIDAEVKPMVRMTSVETGHVIQYRDADGEHVSPQSVPDYEVIPF